MSASRQTDDLRSAATAIDALSEPRPADPGFAVYIHWPFCAEKCPYCDFNSHVRFGGRDGRSGWDEGRFLAAYRAELAHLRELTGQRTVASIFFGGGTPSLMQGATVAALIEEVGRLWQLSQDAEVTLEANPGSVEAGRFRDYRAAGVNRVSLGVQSLVEADLKALGRIHSVAEAKAALSIAVDTFERVSFDLIYARSGQSLPAWRTELLEALSFGPSHLSLYQLTIEPGTAFEKLHRAGSLIVPDEDAAGDMFEVTQELTEAAGLAAYEVSNHARSGQESRHNLIYWRYGEYAGAGPGAHGRLLHDGGRFATITERHPETWLARVMENGSGIVTKEEITAGAAADEMLIMGLRLAEGVDLGRLEAVGGVRPRGDVLVRLQEEGLIEIFEDGERVRAIGRGRFLINSLVLELSSGFEAVNAVAAASS